MFSKLWASDRSGVCGWVKPPERTTWVKWWRSTTVLMLTPCWTARSRSGYSV